MARRRLLPVMFYTIVPILATLVTVATGFLVANGTKYGFPLSWRTWVIFYCLRPGFAGCLSNTSNTSYNWLNFILDTTIYTTILYACIQARHELKRSAVSLHHFLARLPREWNELTRPFRVSVIMGVLSGAYLAYSVLPGLITGWASWSSASSGEGFSGIIAFTIITIVLLVVFAIPVVGAIGLVTLRMRDEQRGILALFVTVYSFVPILFLGFQILGLLLPFWQYLMIGLFWAILLSMSAIIIHSRKTYEGRV